MCGIVGYAGPRDGRPILHKGLSRLEYRGYDSAGIALGTSEGLAIEKTAGRVDDLRVEKVPQGTYGVGHTRWATHGAPTVDNAHPHLSCDGNLAVVHNGVITNAATLKHDLIQRGHTFASDTDTEVISHLLEEQTTHGATLVDAVRTVRAQLDGSYAFVALAQDAPGELVATRNASPLVVGIGEDECFLASDVVAFLEHTDQAVYLHDGDIVHIRQGAWTLFPNDRDAQIETIPWDVEDATRAGYPHFMLKEIHEQPRALRQALVGRLTPGQLPLDGALTLDDITDATDIHLIACGSSRFAAQTGAHLLETHLDIPARVHNASEITNQPPPHNANPLFIAVSQSGETADTLEAVDTIHQAGYPTLAVTNVIGSTLTRATHATLPIRAGPEIGVAATKSFTAQSLALGLLAAHLAHARGHENDADTLLEHLRQTPHTVQDILDHESHYRAAGEHLAHHDDAYILGSGALLPIAHEAALKIKEISYIHAESFPTGELKHGPLALIEDDTPVLVLAPDNDRFDRTLSTIHETAARGAHITALTNNPTQLETTGVDTLPLDAATGAPFCFAATVAAQLIAYQAGVERGCDVDKPRNLAKSVTVT